MKGKSLAIALALTITGGANIAASAESIKTAGMVCWTGDIEYLKTSKKDVAWHWTLDYTFISDDGDAEKASSGRCFGTGGMVAGKVERQPHFCINKAKDGATRMSHIVGGSKGSKGTYFGGTGRYEGISGAHVGGPTTKLPAGKGKIAGCRHSDGEYTITKK